MFHGGGFWIGGGEVGLAVAEPACQQLCAATGAVIVNVDYRQSPEHRFPVPLEDCYAALQWVHDHAAELDVDSDRIGVSGASAGGNLAAAVALLARDGSGPRIAFQQLLVPALDATFASCVGSMAEHGSGLDLTEEIIRVAWQFYAGETGDRTDPLLSPLQAEDLSGLPPAHIVVGEYDPIRDDGVAYAERLGKCGVAVRLSRFAMTHALSTPDVGASYLQDVVTAVRQGLGTTQSARAASTG